MRPLPLAAALLLTLGTLLPAAPARAQGPAGAPAGPALGEVRFPTSGAPAAQSSFLRGVALLHSFEYDEAIAAFREAQRLDPGFAMAYWGEAMAYNHPVWMQQDAAAARAALARLAADPAARRARAKTEREREYLDALEVLYGDGPKEARDSAFARAMGRLAARYPDDEDAAAFHALSLLGTTHGGRDLHTYMRAAAVVEEVFRDHPRHPGAAHYLIHAYDDPVHAPLGLRAARAYAAIAPDAPHAQHMTSHIFVALGMWDEVVAANERAVEVLNRQRAGQGRPPEACGHYPFWLHYGYLQQGRLRDARRVLDACHAEAAATGTLRAVAHFLVMRARHVLDTEAWSGDVLELDVAGGDRPRLRYTRDFVTAFAALRRGDVAAARPLTASLVTGRDPAASDVAYAGATSPPQGEIRVLEMQLQALLLRADGRVDEALTLLRQAAELEGSLPFEFGPPQVEKPAPELLGELLLELDRPAEARAAFEAALRRAPRRTTSLRGLALALERAGDRAAAENVRAELRAIHHRADPAAMR